MKAPRGYRATRHRLLAGSLAFLVSWALPATAAPPPGYHPISVAKVPTYRGLGKTGNMVFSLNFLDAGTPQSAPTLKELAFPVQHPPASWWGRSFHPCTLNEAIDALPVTAREFRIVTVVYLDGERISGTAFVLQDEHLGPTWNTLSWEGASIAADLERLPPGHHTLVIWRYLNYRLPRKEAHTQETVWDHGGLVLAKGELPITVQEAPSR